MSRDRAGRRAARALSRSEADDGTLFAAGVPRRSPTEKSFSRAAEKLFRTQPAVSLAVQRLEAELGEKLIDRAGRTAADRRRPDSCSTTRGGSRTCSEELENALAELRDNSAGRLVIGANESTTLYLLPHIAALPAALPEGEGAGAAQPVEQDSGAADRRRPRAGRHQLRPARRPAGVDRDLHRPPGLRRVAAAPLRRAGRRCRSASSGWRPSSRTTSCRPTARWCCASSSGTRCRCTWTSRCRRWRPSASWCSANEGVAFLPRMCVEQEIEQRRLCEVQVEETEASSARSGWCIRRAAR